MDKKQNIAINICIAGLVICSVGGMASAAFNFVIAYRVIFFIAAWFATVSFWSYKPKGHFSKQIRKSIWMYILIFVIVGVIGFINVSTKWIDGDVFLICYIISGFFVFLLHAIYLVVLKKELADKAC